MIYVVILDERALYRDPIWLGVYVKYGNVVYTPNLIIVSGYVPVRFIAMVLPTHNLWCEIIPSIYLWSKRHSLTYPHWTEFLIYWSETCDIFPFPVNIYPSITYGDWECGTILHNLCDRAFTVHTYFP